MRFLVPGFCSSKWRKNDQRTADWIAGEHAQKLSVVSGERRKLFQRVSGQERYILEIAVRYHVFPRRRTGTEKIRTHRMEHTVRIQRIRLSYFHTTTSSKYALRGEST